MLGSLQVRRFAPGLLFAATCLTGCTVPLGPGFHLNNRQADISQAAATPSRIHIRLTDQLTNAGTRGLAYLNVMPPAALGDTKLNILVDGLPVQATPLTSDPGAPVRIRFNPPWPQQQARSIVFSYDLESNPVNASVAVSPVAFHLSDFGAHWLAPPGVFVTADARARAEELSVTVPAGFLVLAPGREQRQTQQGNLTVHRYRIGPSDPPPFVIAGRYQEARLHTHHSDVIFWTLNPVDIQAAGAAAERLADSVATYQQAFGPAAKGAWPVRIVEMPDATAPVEENESQFRTAPFPYGVLIDQSAFAKGFVDDALLEMAEYQLARTWFGWRTRPRPEDEILLGRGAALFAVVLAAEARGGSAARTQAIDWLLASYDRASLRSATTSSAAPSAQRAVNTYKSALFMAALADIAGQDKWERAVRSIMQSLPGQEISQLDLRSALEAETGRDLAGTFHVWLDHAGIPSDFRARYSAGP